MQRGKGVDFTLSIQPTTAATPVMLLAGRSAPKATPYTAADREAMMLAAELTLPRRCVTAAAGPILPSQL